MNAWARLRRGAAVLLCVIALGGVSSFAADDSTVIFPAGTGPRPAAEAPAGPSAGVANSLTLVVALLFAGAGGWVFWKNRRASAVPGQGQSLRIQETRSLGNRQYLVVASYEGKTFLLGVCPGRIDMLAPLGDRQASEVREL